MSRALRRLFAPVVGGARRLHRLYRVMTVYGFAVSVPLMMRLPLPTVDRVLEILIRKLPTAGAGSRNEVRWAIDRVLFGGLPLPDRRCLTYGLTRYFFLRRSGAEVSLVFGLGPADEGDRFIGHCWILEEGKPRFEPSDPRHIYASMYAMGGDGEGLPESTGYTE